VKVNKNKEFTGESEDEEWHNKDPRGYSGCLSGTILIVSGPRKGLGERIVCFIEKEPEWQILGFFSIQTALV